jgi:hypothetical protein
VRRRKRWEVTCGSDGVGAMEEAQDLQAGSEAVAYSERIT